MDAGLIELWDWRRQVAALYEAVRAARDPEAAWRIWRGGRDTLFRTHSQSPIDPSHPARSAGLPYFPYDPSLRFLAGLRRLAGGTPLLVPAGEDGELRLVPFAATDGLAASLGAELTLYWIAGYGGGVFLPFRDASGQGETYAGGRYLLDTIKGADLGFAPDGRLVLDFNFAYNPSCSYSDRWVCPLAPRENWLAIPIRAGERLTA